MERLPAGRQVSEHKLFGRIYPDECAKIFYENFCAVYKSGLSTFYYLPALCNLRKWYPDNLPNHINIY